MNRIFFLIVVIIISTRGLVYAEAVSPWEDKLPEGRVVFEQKFNWNDELGSGKYTWGYDQYLTMDGSFGKIQCNRLLKEKITDTTSRVEMTLIFVEGRKYRIVLYDLDNKMVVDCRIGREGWVSFSDGKSYIKTKARIGPNTEYAVEYSPPHRFSFGQFDFSVGQFQFSFNGKKDFLPMPFCRKAKNISKIEVQTCVVEPGTIIGLDNYRQIEEPDTIIDEDNFSNYWVPSPAILPGYPDERSKDVTYRPKDHKWLEVFTRYGLVHLVFTKTPISYGYIEFDMLTENTACESQFNMGEYTRNFGPIPGGGWLMNIAIFNGVWTPFQKGVPPKKTTILTPFHTSAPFDNPPLAVANKPYRVRMGWHAPSRTWRAWIDGVLQTSQGKLDLKTGLIKKGIDMIIIHPGNRNMDAGPFLYTRWGNIKVVSYDKIN